MARKCKGDWDSWIGVKYPPQTDRNDGRITVGKVQSSGNFKGTHTKSPIEEHLLDGQCKESPDHHIEFTSEAEGYVYSGKIVVVGKKDWVKNGKRSRIQKARNKKLTDEDWVAVKTT